MVCTAQEQSLTFGISVGDASHEHDDPPLPPELRTHRARLLPSKRLGGTTNEDEYLVDRTGNRRIWAERCTRPIDVAAIVRARDQLWAEAFERYACGERWYANTPRLRALCEAQHADRLQADAWESIVAAWLEEPYETVEEPDEHGRPKRRRYPYDGTHVVLTGDVLLYAIEQRKPDVTKFDTMRAAGVLRTLGYERGPQRRENGAVVRRYVKAVTPVTDSGDDATPENDR